jgi:hypothetical protein
VPSDELSLFARIKTPSEISSTADSKTLLEGKDLEIQAKAALIRGAEQDIDERKKYAHRAFCLVVAWLVVIGIILLLQGFHADGFELSGGVLEILIGSTTGSIVGIFLIVTRYLFPLSK